jgi:DNA-binding NarL/FixJ family response regulator
MPVFVLTGDLFFRAKIEETAKALGLPRPLPLRSADEARGALVLLELGPRTGGVEKVAEIMKASPDARVIAFGSHVDTETLERARELGAADVMPRSRFVRELASILGERRS